MNYPKIIELNGKKYVSAIDLHDNVLELSSQYYKVNVANWLKNDYLFEVENQIRVPILNKDFLGHTPESTGGRPKQDYLLSLELSKLISLESKSQFKKHYVQWLLSLESKRESGQLITPQEAGFILKIIDAFKYANVRVNARKNNENTFVLENDTKKHVYALFNIERSKYTGYNHAQLIEKCKEVAITEKIRAPYKDDSIETLNAKFDPYESLRLAVLDCLMENKVSIHEAQKFAGIVKELATAANIKLYFKNETNLFQSKETIENPKSLFRGVKKMLNL